MKLNKEKWVWMPHAGHFILGSQCRFRLNTYVNGYIISTVGEYVPDSEVRRIFRKSRGWDTYLIGDAEEVDFIKRTGGAKGFGEEIGLDRKYETMVFKAKRSKYKCCPWEMENPSSLDMDSYNLSADAYAGHLKMCARYAKRKK